MEGGHCRDRETFIRSLYIFFDFTTYNNPMEALTRLKQTTFVATYKAQFEVLSNQLRGILDFHKLSYFLNGLKDEIGLPILKLNPLNLNAHLDWQSFQEEYLTSRKRYAKIVAKKGVFSGEGSSGLGPYSIEGNSKWLRHSTPHKKILSTQMDEMHRNSCVTDVMRCRTTSIFVKQSEFIFYKT